MRRSGARHWAAFALAALVVLVLDQLTKHWAIAALSDGPIDLVGSLRLNLVFNDGAAFSIGGGGGSTRTITIIGLVVAAAVAWMGMRADRLPTAVGFGIIFGGALGNLADRLLRDGDGFMGGRVVDMVDLQWWPIFNLADAALWVGIAVLLITSRADEQEP